MYWWWYLWAILASVMALPLSVGSSSSSTGWRGWHGDAIIPVNQTLDFRLVGNETVLHQGWRVVTNRQIRMPSGRLVDFEVVGQRGTDQAVVVLAWHRATQTVTLVREYTPSVQRFMLGLPAGMVEDRKHDASDAWTAARAELLEEARLEGGIWYQLGERPTVMDKYSTTGFTVFLCIDPIAVAADRAPPRDAGEEGLEIITGVTVAELRTYIHDGNLTVVGGWAVQRALHKLKELGEIE